MKLKPPILYTVIWTVGLNLEPPCVVDLSLGHRFPSGKTHVNVLSQNTKLYVLLSNVFKLTFRPSQLPR